MILLAAPFLCSEGVALTPMEVRAKIGAHIFIHNCGEGEGIDKGMTKKSRQTRVHAFWEPIPCQGIDCKVRFRPVRKDQAFCCQSCRVKYFSFARILGEMLLKRSERSRKYKSIVDGFLFQARANDAKESP